MFNLRFTNANDLPVIGEATRVRERNPKEEIHLAEDDATRCKACGKKLGLWLESSDRWADHPAKCNGELPDDDLQHHGKGHKARRAGRQR